MVVDGISQDEIDLLFHALSDATRRDIVSRVIQEEQSVSTLAGRYEISFAAVQKHVAVLERAGLVTKERRGREQIVHSNMNTIRGARELLHSYEELWRQRAGRIADILAEGRGSSVEERTSVEEKKGRER
jgi:DNA-binding transcriptional ArsR family regulator